MFIFTQYTNFLVQQQIDLQSAFGFQANR